MSDTDMVTKTCLLSEVVEHIIFQEASVNLIKKNIKNEIKDSKIFHENIICTCVSWSFNIFTTKISSGGIYKKPMILFMGEKETFKGTMI